MVTKKRGKNIQKKETYVTSTPKRSFLKAFTWELSSFVITLVAVYLVYGDIKMSLKFSLFLSGVKVIFLYLHERIWKKVLWGKVNAKKNSGL